MSLTEADVTARASEENQAWLNAKLAERGLTGEVYREAVEFYKLAQATWTERFWRAYEYAHNEHHAPSWELARFGHAYADVTERWPSSMHLVWTLWRASKLEPDAMGTYHREGPWASPQGEVAV